MHTHNLAKWGITSQGGNKMNIERIQSRLSRLITYLESNENQRMTYAVEDCLMPDISDELRQAAYTALRTQAKIQGLIEYLPTSGQRALDPALVEAFAHIDEQVANFVEAGFNASNDTVNIIMRPKKNKQGHTHYNQQTLTETIVASAKRWYREAYKNQMWSGNISTMNDVSEPSSPTTNNNNNTKTKKEVKE
jgi:hypothetical protein